MKKIIFILCLFGLVTNITLKAQPVFEIEGGITVDFGQVSKNLSPVKRDVRIYNKGNDTLKILYIKPTCGCTIAPLDKKIIAPGDFATLSITLHLNVSHGQYSKMIRASSNDPNFVDFSIILNAFVLNTIQLSAPEIDFGNIKTKKNSIAKFNLTNLSDKDIIIKSIKTIPENMKVNIKEGRFIAPNTNLEFETSITMKQKGAFNGSIIIESTDKLAPTLTIPVKGMVE